jgi:DNA-binding transcriptional regulator YdaS (Cro superfamily)
METNMHLDEYLKEAGESQNDFGKKLKPPVSQGLVAQWVKGKTRVTLSSALQIERLTDGKVTPKDCADMFAESEKTTA